MAFGNLVNHFKELLARRKTEKLAAREHEKALLAAIEHVVDSINPKLRAIPGYKSKLKPCVSKTLAYCDGVVEHVPGPVDVNSNNWSRNPLVRPFFSSAQDVRDLYSHSRDVRNFFDNNPLADECYVLLSAIKNERTVLGMELQGDVMKRDVKQTTVGFADRRLVKPADSELNIREELKHRALEVLVGYALENITRLVETRHVLQEEKLLLKMKHNLDTVRHDSLGALFEEKHSANESVAAESLKNHQQASEHLKALNSRLSTLGDYINRIADVLEYPETFLQHERITLRLNKMNIKISETSAAAADTLELTEFSLGESLRRVVLITRFARSDLQEKQEFL